MSDLPSVSVLTWVVYCLLINTDVQDTAREEVRQVCAEAEDVSLADVDKMMYVIHCRVSRHLSLAD